METYIPGEEFEQEYFYRMLVDYAKEHAFPLAEQAYAGAAAAEKEHTLLLKEAADMDGFSRDVIYVCPVCGYVMTGDKAPERCPVCGGPKKQYEAYVKE